MKKLDARAIDARTLARLSPAGFATYVSKGHWRLAPHLDALSRRLVDAACGRCPRLLVLMPVRHGKSELVSKFLPAWFLGTFPDEPVILASYEASFAASWGRKARDLLELYGREVFGVRVSKGTRSASQWTLEGHAGGMVTAGAGGPLVGRGAKLLILDDLVKNAEEACSKVLRERVWDWFRSTAFTRVEPAGAIVIVMTRWHEDDLAGRLLREAEAGGEPWEVLSFPAIAEEGDPLGRAPGEALWPERFDEAALAVKRRAVGSYWWSAVYQQRPAPADGGLFKRAWFRHYTEGHAPNVYRLGDGGPLVDRDGLVRFATVDLACSTRETADYTVIASWGAAPDGRLILLDLVRARLEGPDIVPAIRRAVDRWQLAVVGVEKVGFQLALIQEARRAGLPIREVEADRDKVARALVATAALEAGKVWFPRAAPWLGDLEAELLAFPAAAHDDQVDALSYAVAFGARVARPPPLPFEVAEPKPLFLGFGPPGPIDWSTIRPNRPIDLGWWNPEM